MKEMMKDLTFDRAVRVNNVHRCAATVIGLLSLTLMTAPRAFAGQNDKADVAKKTVVAKKPVAVVVDKIPTAVEMESWRKTILATPRPTAGCHVATFPETAWREVACKEVPHKLYPPKRMGAVRVDTVGNTSGDFSATVTGHLTQAEGSFDSVSGVTSESSPDGSNSYSLQLNSKPFTTTTCGTSTTGCQGWEQFVYSSGGGGFIQYWLENFGPAGTQCPTPRGASCSPGNSYSDGWCPFQFSPTGNVYCVVNAKYSSTAPAEAITNLGQLKMTGAASGVNGNTEDSVTVTVGNTVYAANGNNYFPDLGNTWQEVEFNVFGDGNGDEASFNTGSTLVVRNSVVSGSGDPPGCDDQSFTGETNNLTLVQLNPPVAHSGEPSLVFKESNVAGSTPVGCSGAVAVGDTHITTFDGLHYDFQAAGEFVLVDNGPDFIVQNRQASGAPTWPNADVNKAIAVRMGKTTVAVYIEPTVLSVDGENRSLADGGVLQLPTGVQINRHGNVYVVTDDNGNRVQTTLNSTWIDVAVNLGSTPTVQARGLLGNPGGNATELETGNHVALREPVAFNDLYHTYADSWRVPSNGSLFNVKSNIEPGIALKTFGPTDLDAATRAAATAKCTAAGVTNKDLLNDCIIDNAVLKDPMASKVFVKMRTPVRVMRPVFTAVVVKK